MPPHEKTCNDIQAHIDDLSQTQLHDMHLPKSITDHVRSCEACKVYLDQMLALADRLEVWDVPEPKKSIGTGVMTQVAQLERDHRFNLADIGRQCVELLAFRVRMPAAVAAILILGLCVSVMLNITAWQQDTTQGKIATADPDQTGRVRETVTSVPQSVGQDGPSQSNIRVVGSTQELQSFLHRSLSAPSTFVIILGAPLFPLSQEGWLTQPVDTLGTGTSGINLSPKDIQGTTL